MPEVISNESTNDNLTCSICSGRLPDESINKQAILRMIDIFLENRFIDNVPSSITLSLLKHRLTEPDLD